MSDKDKFADLIEDMRNLISDLNQLTDDYGVSQSRSWIIKYEMEKVEDENSLEAITEVNSAGDDEVMSVAATRQLNRIKERSIVQVQGVLEPDDSVSVFRDRALVATNDFEEDVEIGPQLIEVTRVPPRQWRNVKTRQGVFSYLGTLIASTETEASTNPQAAESQLKDDNKAWSFLQRANTFTEDSSELSTTAPLRLAINSKTLLTALSKITGRTIPESHNVLVHPFKYLVFYEDRIKNALAEIELHASKLEPTSDTIPLLESPPKLQETDADSTVVDTSSTEDQVNWKRIKEELSCLVNFMDTDLGEIFRVKRMIHERTLSEISFEHLWLLYTPGDLVFSEGRDEERSNAQAYFVLHVTGGRPILDDTDSSEVDLFNISSSVGDVHIEDDFLDTSYIITPFVVDCFYLDTDGRTIGPRPKRFIMSPYAGTRPVKSLPIYPLTREEWDKTCLVQRGRKFVKCHQTQHLRYSGSSLIELEDGHTESCTYCSLNNFSEDVSPREDLRTVYISDIRY